MSQKTTEPLSFFAHAKALAETYLETNDVVAHTALVDRVFKQPEMAIPIGLDLWPEENWPYPVADLRQPFLEKTVCVKTVEEYKETLFLWLLLGGHYWTWHKGYPLNSDGPIQIRLGECGLLKEITHSDTYAETYSTYTATEFKAAAMVALKNALSEVTPEKTVTAELGDVVPEEEDIDNFWMDN